MTKEQLERIIKMAAEKAATAAVRKLRDGGKITHAFTPSFRKTEELLYLYPNLSDGNEIKKKIDKALESIKDDEYYGVIESRYFDNLKIVEIADIYDCKYQNISKKRNKLVKMLASKLFPEDVAEEIMNK